jgi:hypothetical protein
MRVNTFIILHTKEGAFKIRNQYETFKFRKFQNFEFVVLFLDPKLHNNSAVRLVLLVAQQNFHFPILGRNLNGKYP